MNTLRCSWGLFSVRRARDNGTFSLDLVGRKMDSDPGMQSETLRMYVDHTEKRSSFKLAGADISWS